MLKKYNCLDVQEVSIAGALKECYSSLHMNVVLTLPDIFQDLSTVFEMGYSIKAYKINHSFIQMLILTVIYFSPPILQTNFIYFPSKSI